MKLYVVVRHVRDPRTPPWPNIWLEEDKLWAIKTTAEIGRLCERAKQKNEPIFVHRCAVGKDVPAVVCCSAFVVGVDLRGCEFSLVTFGVHEVLNTPPTVPPEGRNYYFA